MDWRYAFIITFIAFITVNCSQTKTLSVERSRMIQPSQISSFHPEIKVMIGWMPYQDQEVVQTAKDEWKVVKHKTEDNEGVVPTLLIIHPHTQDSIFLNMNIENELLGKLIKHSAMTQQPISRPFTQFFEEAKCESCHPADVKIPFN